uniref:SEC63 domain-containing protein n=1 Tax=Neobodo designis TaxID=312471 RepID=A0A7S1QMK3_NEODS|mmetsp:Transcript_48676/g.150293  ORF Transcript_48676/g.150293 Transcript_48676/m.150293 type:complete len:383 (+) Transcript_48676:100-1248(+)
MKTIRVLILAVVAVCCAEAVSVYVSLTEATLLSGGLTDCPTPDHEDCEGGIASALALVRNRTAAPHFETHFVICEFDRQAPFVQMHPLDWGVNTMLFDYFGLPIMTVRPSLFTTRRDIVPLTNGTVRPVLANVDISANNGHLHAALKAMSLLQCMVQARWWNDHTLLQLPHVTPAMLPGFERAGITHIGHLANGTVDVHRKARRVLEAPDHGLSQEAVEEVVYAMQRLPLVDVKISMTRLRSSQAEAEAEASSGDDEVDVPAVPASVPEDDDPTTFRVAVELTRLSTRCKYVVAPHFSKPKDEQYWVAIGNEATGELVALKRVNRLWRRTTVQLVFEWDNEWLEALGDVDAAEVPLQVYVVCDSFLGLDQQYSFNARPLGAV